DPGLLRVERGGATSTDRNGRDGNAECPTSDGEVMGCNQLQGADSHESPMALIEEDDNGIPSAASRVGLVLPNRRSERREPKRSDRRSSCEKALMRADIRRAWEWDKRRMTNVERLYARRTDSEV